MAATFLPVDSPLWTIQPEIRQKYEAQFRKLSPQADYAGGDSIKQLMMMSGLPPMVLAKIWSLSDVDVDGRMDVNEFSIALHLIALKMKGFELPDQLPPALMNLVKPPTFAAFNKHDSNNASNNSINRGMSQSASASSNISQRSATTPTSVSGGLPGAGGALAAGEWAIPPIIRRKYTQLFNQHDRNRTGHLTGLQAKGILMETKLPQTTLASLWNLSDVDADGKLTCDEFVLCMFLVEKAKNNEILPLKLPPELVPPSYRRSGSITHGTLSHHSSIDDATMDEQQKSSFEDKRRENYEKGQAELDRRRQALMEQEKRAREERERKEREEAARKEKIRLEEERRKQEEIERAQQLARQKQLELEEQKRRAQEVRELARREMERQRQQELDKQRRTELMNTRTRLADEVQKLKAHRKQIGLEHEKVDKQIMEGKTNCKISRDRIVRVKSEIDAMRTKRDEIIAKQNAIKNQIKALTDQTLCIEQEKVRLSTQVKTLFANAGNGATEEQASTFDSMLQAKRLAINQLKAHIERYEQEGIQKQHDLTNSRRELDEMRRRYEAKRAEARSYADLIESKRQEAEAVRDGRGHGANADGDVWTAEVPSNFEWPANNSTVVTEKEASLKPTEPGTTQTKFKYRCVFAYEARNADEISINPGDIVMVNTSAASEPDWLSGEINGKVGWFPAAYAELVDENADDANAHVTNPEDAFTLVSQALANAEQNAVQAQKEGIVLYDYSTTEEGYLELKKDDRVRVISEDGAWMYGELLDESGNVKVAGWFPDGYLDFGTGIQAVSQDVSQVVPVSSNTTSGDSDYYLALYAFESQQDGDLEFAVDELIKIEKRDGEWWTGVIVDRNTGALIETRRGIFPSNFVTPASANDIPGQKAGEAPKSTTPEPAAIKTHVKLDRKESEGITSSPKPKKGKAKKLEIVTAIAAYTASGAEQLSLEVGQLIQVRKKMDSGWWEGELQAKGKKKQVGWFPASYVKPLGASAGGQPSGSTPEPTKARGNAADEPEIDRVVASFPYVATNEDELTLETNDVVRVLAKLDQTWWRGHNIRTDAVGLFPSNHILFGNKNSTDNHPNGKNPIVFDWYYSPPMNDYYYDEVSYEPVETNGIAQSKSEPVDLNSIENDRQSTESFDSDSDSQENYSQNDNALDSGSLSETVSQTQSHEALSNLELFKREQANERLRKFGEIFFEFLQTEKLYVDNLQFAVENFRKPMLESPTIGYVPREEIETYFMHLDKVLRTNHQFYRSLDDILRGGHVFDVIFEMLENNFRKMLPIYEEFCYNQVKASRKLQQRIEKDKVFKAYLEELEASSQTGLPLSSFLLKPMQRITKYPLFMSRFMKVASTSNPEYKKIEQVYRFSQTLCKEINDRCKMYEMLDIFGWLETHVTLSYKNCDQMIHFRSETKFMGSRVLLFSGILNKLPSNKHLIVFLFNDFLLFTRPNKRTPKLTPNSNFFNLSPDFLKELQYDGYRKPYLLDDVSIVDQKSDFDSNWHQNLFRLMIHSSKCQIVLSSNSAIDCDGWIKAIQKAKTAYCDSKRSFIERTLLKTQISSKPRCVLFITILEGANFYSSNFALNASCKLSIGDVSKNIRFSEITEPSRVELSKTKSLNRRNSTNSLRQAKSLNNLLTNEQNLKVYWNKAFRIFLESSDEFLKIECFDENPFAHSQSLGEWRDSLEKLGINDGINSQPITKQVSLKMTNLLNSPPSVLLRYTFLPINST